MSNAQRRALFLLTAALLLVTGLLLLPTPTLDGDSDWSAAFPGLDGDEVRRLEVRRGGIVTVLERSSTGWSLEEPVRGRADQVRVGTMIRDATSLEVRPALLDATPVAYGLGPEERVEVVMVDRTGVRRVFQVGAETAVGTGTYVSLEGKVRPARGLLAQGFSLAVDDLRESRVWTESFVDLTSLTLDLRGQRSVFMVTDGDWHDATGSVLGPDSAIGPWLASLQDLRIIRFEGGPTEIADPWGSVELREPDGSSRSLLLGLEVEGGGYWATVPNQAGTVAVEGSVARLLEEGLALLGRADGSSTNSQAGQSSSP